MALDPNIALGVKSLELPNQLAQYGQLAQIQNAQNQNQLAQYQLGSAQRAEKSQNMLADAYAQSTDPSTGKIDYNKLTGLLAAGGGGAQLPAIQKSRMEQETAQTAQQKATVELGDAKLKQSRQFLDTINPTDPNAPAQYIAWHEANHRDPILGPMLAARGVTADQSRQRIQDAIAKGPEEFAKLLNQSKLGTEKFMEMNKPVTSVGPTGIVQTPGLGGAATIVPGTSAAFQMTPAQIAANRIAQGQLAVSQGQLKVAQDRLAKDGAQLDPAQGAALSKAIIEGRLDPNRVNGRNAKILADTLMANPAANLLELGVSAGGAMASEKSLATQTAKMSTAANEASQMVNVVRNLSDKVDRGEFPSINAIQNAVAKGTGGKEIVQLNTSINALVNSYARAISPTGQPTVSDKNHAREIINASYSQGQLGSILDVMQQEMDIAKGAAVESSAALKAGREAAKGRPSAATSTADQQAEAWANANPTDPRAAQIKQRLGR